MVIPWESAKTWIIEWRCLDVCVKLTKTFTIKVLAIQKKQDENKPKGWQEWNEAKHLWPKNSLKCFLWMKAETLILLYCKASKVVVFQECRKVQFLVFLFLACLLFCRLLWSGLGELVSVMEHDLGCSMNTFYELCESQFR